MAFPRLNQGFRSPSNEGGGGSGGGAPTDAEFVVVGLNSQLTAARVIAGETGVITLVDNGPSSTLVIGIQSGGVTFSKFQNITTGTLLGRSSGGSGSVEQLSVGSGLSLVGGVLAATGGGGGGFQGVASLDFGPNTQRQAMTQVAVTGQTTITPSSIIFAEVRIAGTADHTADEVRVETLKVTAGDITAGVGFTVYGEIQLGKTYGHFDVNWSWA